MEETWIRRHISETTYDSRVGRVGGGGVEQSKSVSSGASFGRRLFLVSPTTADARPSQVFTSAGPCG